jgi:hypothetical protein
LFVKSSNYNIPLQPRTSACSISRRRSARSSHSTGRTPPRGPHVNWPIRIITCVSGQNWCTDKR